MGDVVEAVTAVANATGKVADIVTGIGRYAADVLGDVPKEYVALKWQEHQKRRVHNIEQMAHEAVPQFEHVDKSRISEPTPSLIIPLIIASADEERPELRKLWASLLANSAIDGGARVRREFFETVRNFEPIDAVILDIFDEPVMTNPNGHSDQLKSIINLLTARKVDVGLNNINILVSFEALKRLRCVDRQSNTQPWHLMPYGTALKSACKVS